jgi:hypothetical protein
MSAFSLKPLNQVAQPLYQVAQPLIIPKKLKVVFFTISPLPVCPFFMGHTGFMALSGFLLDRYRYRYVHLML